MPEKSKLKLDDFTAKVVSDPSQPQQTTLLQGFLGASSEPDHTRIYSDVTLDSYIDVANADIIHIEPLPKEQSPLGGSYLWVKQSGEALTGAPGPDRAKAKFLEGPIASEAAAVAAPLAPKPPLPKTVVLQVCHPTIIYKACPPPVTHQVFCHPSLTCPTKPIVCLVASANVQCHLPDPTIYEQGPVFQANPTAVQAAQPEAMQQGAAAAQYQFYPSVVCPTAFCPRTYLFNCHFPTPHCPQYVPQYPIPVASVACQQQIPVAPEAAGAAHAAAAFTPAIPASQTLQQCPSLNAAICPSAKCPTPLHHCPSVGGYQCPTVNSYHCPSVQGYQCPSVSGYQCPSVSGFHCPSVQHYQCPSVLNYHCPATSVCTEVGPHCQPTPNPQHCPTPNMMCPRTVSDIGCQSVAEICPTSSELFC